MDATATTLSRADRVGMYLTIALGVLGAIATVWAAVIRLAEVLGSAAIPVLVPFVGETAQLPIGPGGALLDVEVEQAIVRVTDPAPATYAALVAEPIVGALALLAGIALLCIVCIQLARGRAFAAATVRAVWIGITAVVGGWFLARLCTTMGVNGTLSAVSDYGYDGTRFELNAVTFFSILALGAIGAAFQIGHRLQRETEGLV